MIRFKNNNNNNNNIKHELTNEEINLKIHEMLLNFYKSRNITYTSDVYEGMTKGYYNKMFNYIKNIFMIIKQ